MVFYNDKIANCSYVDFDGYSNENDLSVEALSNITSLDDLATSVVVGTVLDSSVNYAVRYVTPTLVENLNDLGMNFSYNPSNDYVEGYVSSSMSKDYIKGEIYDIGIENSEEIDQTERVKIVGYYENSLLYYCFDNIYLTAVDLWDSIVICNELPSYAMVSTGIFINEQSCDYYNDLGFTARSSESIYLEQLDESSYKLYFYLAVIAVIFSIASIFCNYMLNIDKITKKAAIQYACGQTHKSQIITEIVKMSAIYTVSFLINLVVSTILSNIEIYGGVGIVNMDCFVYASLIMLGIYVVSVSIGFFKYAKTKPLKIINNQRG